MTPEQKISLIDHLDESLRGKPAATLEQIIGDDPEAGKEWYYLCLAIDAVRDAGLNDQVAAARAGWKAEQSATATDAGNIAAATSGADDTTAASSGLILPEAHATSATAMLRPVLANNAKPSSGSRVHTLYRYTLRAAACILIIAGSAAIYKYVSVSSGSLYDRYYSSYSLNTARGAGDASPLVEAYNAKDWAAVRLLAGTADAAKTRNNQTDFLAGMACLEQKQYDEAISHFEQVIAVNAHAGTDYYQDESEYYLAISWLARKNVNEAMPILEKIRANRRHQYHEKVMKMSFFDLRLVQYKENK